MATLQNIRSKGPLLVIVIGLALFAFIAGDAWKVMQLHIGAPDEPGEDIQQIVLHYFQESKKRTFTIVMLVYDEEAETDLNAITSSIQITQ